MAIKARWKKNQKVYIFLGVGYGTYKAMMAVNLAHLLAPDVESKEIGMVALCDRDGSVGWVDYSEVEIVEIDGVAPAELLDSPPPNPPSS